MTWLRYMQSRRPGSGSRSSKVQVQDDKFDAFCREMREDMATVKRGIYGDPSNKVRGLLERQDDDETRMDGLEARQEKTDRKLWKIGVMMGAGVAAVDFIIMYIKNFTTK